MEPWLQLIPLAFTGLTSTPSVAQNGAKALCDTLTLKCHRAIYLPQCKFSKMRASDKNLQQRAEASASREYRVNRSTHSIPCKCACAVWVPMRAAQRLAPQGRPRTLTPEMAMARWPMAALLSSVAPIGCHPSDVIGMSPAWNRSAATLLRVGGWP